MKPEAKTLIITHGNNSSPFIRFQDGKSDRYIQIANLHLGHLGPERYVLSALLWAGICKLQPCL